MLMMHSRIDQRVPSRECKQGRPELPIGPISEIWTPFEPIITISSLIKKKKILTKFYSGLFDSPHSILFHSP